MSSALTIRHTREDVTARKNAESSAQVKRYRPGKAPAWIDENEVVPLDEEQRIDEDEQEEVEEALAATRVAAPVILKKVADPRLARLAVKKDSDDEEDEVAAPRIVSRRQARDDSDEGSVEDAEASGRDSEEEDDEEVEARRAAVRARLQNRRNEAEEEVLATEGLDEEEEEEEESEYETDSEDEQFGRPMLKPVFVTKKERETIAEREALEKEQLDAMKKEKARVAARAHETKEILISRLRQEEEAARAAREGPKEVGDIDTDDESQLEADFEAWRVREHQRIRRDREEREKLREAEEEKERLRNMTAEERQKWERENPRVVHQGPKKTLKFMQKYWHKGAFFQEVSDNPHAAGMQPDSIYLRDYSAPTGEDKLNKEMLPKVMQVKNFGRRGRTKYTHLADQDTTTRDEYYMQEGMKQPKRRHAGTDQVFEKPKNHNT